MLRCAKHVGNTQEVHRASRTERLACLSSPDGGKKTEQPGGQAMGSHLSLDQSSEGGGDTVTLGRLVHLLVEYI